MHLSFHLLAVSNSKIDLIIRPQVNREPSKHGAKLVQSLEASHLRSSTIRLFFRTNLVVLMQTLKLNLLQIVSLRRSQDVLKPSNLSRSKMMVSSSQRILISKTRMRLRCKLKTKRTVFSASLRALRAVSRSSSLSRSSCSSRLRSRSFSFACYASPEPPTETKRPILLVFCPFSVF